MTHDGPVDNIRVHQCISGFTQTERRLTGLFRLHEHLCRDGYNNHVSRVRLDRWNTNWSDVAENIWLLGQHHEAHVVVDIYAYSWGVGWGAVQLCRELKKRSISVHTLVACDGVYRHPWFRLPSLLARDGHLSPTIRIPSNVRFVRSFFQRNNRPQGHHIKGDQNFSGSINETEIFDASHQFMDDSEAFHAAAMTAAELLRKVT